MKTGMGRAGCLFFGICVISFTPEQLFYLRATAAFVPQWIPPGQMFWAVITTIALAVTALALLSGVDALLASRLLTIVILEFQLLVWSPALFHDPRKLFNWAGNAQNLSIVGGAWFVVDFLARSRATASTPELDRSVEILP